MTGEEWGCDYIAEELGKESAYDCATCPLMAAYPGEDIVAAWDAFLWLYEVEPGSKSHERRMAKLTARDDADSEQLIEDIDAIAAEVKLAMRERNEAA